MMAELLLGSPLFPGESGMDQLVEIIKVGGAVASRAVGCPQHVVQLQQDWRQGLCCARDRGPPSLRQSAGLARAHVHVLSATSLRALPRAGAGHADA